MYASLCQPTNGYSRSTVCAYVSHSTPHDIYLNTFSTHARIHKIRKIYFPSRGKSYFMCATRHTRAECVTIYMYVCVFVCIGMRLCDEMMMLGGWGEGNAPHTYTRAHTPNCHGGTIFRINKSE